jgi:hypothetical protein
VVLLSQQNFRVLQSNQDTDLCLSLLFGSNSVDLPPKA